MDGARIIKVGISSESSVRFEKLKQLNGGNGIAVISNALRLYEAMVNKLSDSQVRGGVLFASVKYPDGTREEEEIFKGE